MIVATAGHVDHGKTSLIKALTGIDPSRLPEEHARGMTIDLGFAYHHLSGPDNEQLIGFVDVPGHERFVRNMLAGVAAIDYVLLVIAADDGPMPQTREHLAILELLGIQRGVVALTKVDRVSPERLAAAQAEVAELLAPTPFSDFDVVPTASLEGTGIPDLQARLRNAAAELNARASDAGFRFAIDRSFILDGAGRVVTGTIFSGGVKVGDELVLAPSNATVRVRSIHAHNRPAEAAIAGTRCGINLTGNDLRRHEIRRGDWLIVPTLHQTSKRLGVRLRVLPSETKALRDRAPVHVHMGAADILGRVSLLNDHALEPGESGYATLVLEEPVVAVHGDKFVLRDQSATRTLSGGEVLDAIATPRVLSRARRIEVLNALCEQQPSERLDGLLQTFPDGVPLAWYQRCCNLSDEQVVQQLKTLNSIAITSVKDGFLALPIARWTALLQSIHAVVEKYHYQHPTETGLAEAEIVKVLTADYSAKLVRLGLSALLTDTQLERRANVLALTNFSASLSTIDQALWKRLENLLKTRGHQPPALNDIPELLGVPIDVLKLLVDRVTKQGRLLHVAKYRYFLPQSIGELAEVAQRLAQETANGAFTAREYRDKLGIGRNVSIEVLEYFDRTGLTLRKGDVRSVRRTNTSKVN